MCSPHYYAGLDLHKKTIVFCVKQADGTLVEEGTIRAVKPELERWLCERDTRCVVALEATMFTGWVYDVLVSHEVETHVGHPYMLRAIAAAKKKNDKVDARMLADLLRCDLFPSCYMAPEKLRELRRVMRYRNFLVRESVRMQTKTAGLLMEVGAEYNKKKLKGRKYFTQLVNELTQVPESVRRLLRLSHDTMEAFERHQQWMVDELARHPDLCERVERLMTIDGVGVVTALTWALEIGPPSRFASIGNAVSYCGLCSAQRESAGVAHRGPISKQRNKHLQRVLVEAAKLAPRWNAHLAGVYDKERERGADHNQATLTVARKLVAYLLAVDRSGKVFEQRKEAA
ncbi:MAG: IS110 family transposase [Candidatus Hydrogenedentes bacterium]|nr:IS110 family transposase [Candidatus Hydrogenedentota bacterium]